MILLILESTPTTTWIITRDHVLIVDNNNGRSEAISYYKFLELCLMEKAKRNEKQVS
jgi:hypothetical protein